MHRVKVGPPGKLRIVAGSLRGSRLAVPDTAGSAADAGSRARNVVQLARAGRRRRALPRSLRRHRRARHRGHLARRGRVHVRRKRSCACAPPRGESDATQDRQRARARNRRVGRCWRARRSLSTSCSSIRRSERISGTSRRACSKAAAGWPRTPGFMSNRPQTRDHAPPSLMLHREGHAGAVRYALYRRAPADPLS